MLSRVFKIDVLKCDCGGDLKPLGAVQDPDQVRKYLKHVNIEYDAPVRGPLRARGSNLVKSAGALS
jgi:hypothetical protein